MEPNIIINVLPGGIMPKRQTEGAIGFDTHIRAVVSDSEMDRNHPVLRKTLFDFKNWPEDPKVKSHVHENSEHGLIYRMEPHESVLVGIGFVTAMPFPMFYWMAPRSGLSSKWGITVTNAPGTVDPDYRGEAGVLVYNRNSTTFDIHHGMRISQIIFQWALIPEFQVYEDLEKLPKTLRGSGGFGSTGI